MASTWAVFSKDARFVLKLCRHAPSYEIGRLCIIRNVFNASNFANSYYIVQPLSGYGHLQCDLSRNRLLGCCQRGLHGTALRNGSDVNITTEHVIKGQEKVKLIKLKKEAKREARLERLRQKEAKSNVRVTLDCHFPSSCNRLSFFSFSHYSVLTGAVIS